MNSSSKFNSFFTLIIVSLVFFLSSCSERSEYGEKSDYEKLGATCIPSASADDTAPNVSSVSPADNSTYNSHATTVAVAFNEKMETSSVTTNTSDTTCSGSFQLSSDNFTTCIKMSATPVASDNDTTFTITPASSLSAVTTFKVKITTSVTDISCNTLGSDNSSIVGFSISPSGSGTISGSVQMDNGSPLSGVNLSDELWGSTVATTTSDSDGDFSQTSLALGSHTLTYSKSGYLDLTMNELLETDGQNLILETVRMIPDNCTSGTMSGNITNAVTGDNLTSVYVAPYTFSSSKNRWTYYGESTFTNSSGQYSFSDMDPDRYAIWNYKSGYIAEWFYINACGTTADQNNSLSPELTPGAMRIMLSWPKTNPQTGTDLDGHLYIPIIDIDASRTDDSGACDGDANAGDKCHLNYRTNQATDAVYDGATTDDYHIYGTGDNVTLDRDHSPSSSIPSPPGYETITISKVRSGTYSFSVHNYIDKDSTSSDNLSKSRAKVKVWYNKDGNLITKKFHPPPANGTLWRVFTFNSSNSGSGFNRTRTMTYEDTRADVY